MSQRGLRATNLKSIPQLSSWRTSVTKVDRILDVIREDQSIWLKHNFLVRFFRDCLILYYRLFKCIGFLEV